MTVLVAVVALDGSPVAPDDLGPVLGVHRAVFGTASAVQQRGAPFACAVLLDDRSKAAVATGASPDGPPHRDDDDGSWWLSVGTAYGPDGQPVTAPTAPAVLDGQFGAVWYDRDAQEFCVATDPLGLTPMYIARRNGRAYVSTSSLALARFTNATADRLAVQSFLLAGYHFGNGTHWSGVQRLEPGHLVRLGANRDTTERYWQPEVMEDVRRLPFAAAVDRCIDVAAETFRTRLRELEAWTDLTGGFDSRLLALLLRRAGVPFRTNTRQSTDPAEVPLAEKVASSLGVPWTHPALPLDWPEVLPGRLSSSLAWGDASLEVLQLSRVLWAHEQLSSSLSSLISGGGGEHFQYAAWKSEFGQAGRSNRVNLDNWIDMRMIKPVAQSVLRGRPLPAIRENYRERLSRWIAPYSSEVNTTQLDVLYAYKSTGHFGAYRAADGCFLSAQLPLYFRPVFETVISVDYRYRNNHRLMRHMIHRLDPDVASIQTTRGAPAQPWSLRNTHRFAPYYAQLARKAVTKVSDKVLAKPLLLENRQFPWRAEANARVLATLAAEGLFVPGELRSASLYEDAALADLLAHAKRPGFTQDALLGRIITVELALAASQTEIA